MYCQKCGTQNNDESKFCCNCAAPLTNGVVAESSKKEVKSKLFSANILNIISAVVLILSVAVIAYGVSTSVGGVDRVTESNGSIIAHSSTTTVFDASGAPFAYKACAIDAIIVLLGFAICAAKSLSTKKKLAVLYMIGACVMTCALFFGGVRTISFTCGIGFVMTVAGILQIVAGAKFLSATKDA